MLITVCITKTTISELKCSTGCCDTPVVPQWHPKPDGSLVQRVWGSHLGSDGCEERALQERAGSSIPPSPPFLPCLLTVAFKLRCSPLMVSCSCARAGSGLPPNFPAWRWACLVTRHLPGKSGLQRTSTPLQIRKALVSPPLDSRCLCLGPSQWCPPWPAHKSLRDLLGLVAPFFSVGKAWCSTAKLEWRGVGMTTVTNCTLGWPETQSEKHQGPRWSRSTRGSSTRSAMSPMLSVIFMHPTTLFLPFPLTSLFSENNF